MYESAKKTIENELKALFTNKRHVFVIWGQINEKANFNILNFFLIGCHWGLGFDYCAEIPAPCDRDEDYTKIARLQKPSSLGKTNPKQRWKDVESCGGMLGDPYFSRIWFGTVYKHQGVGGATWYEFNKCLMEKGYTWIKRCGRKNTETDKGICNE